MKFYYNSIKLFAVSMLVASNLSCSSDDDNSGTNSVIPSAPSTYVFERGGESTVNYDGQITRLMQADELYSALNDASSTEAALDLMFGGDGSASAGFANEDLNGTSKLIRSKTSALANSATNRPIFDGWITDFSDNVVPNFTGDASDGTAGAITTGTSTYQVNAQGQELDQLFFKSLIGAFTLDQIINNYITPSQLDSGTRRDENTAGTLEEGDPYTTMEHKWDEGFGYLYGQVADVTLNFGLPAEGEATGNLLMKYFQKVENTFEPGIAERVYNAFIAGRHAITIADYDARDAAATTIKTELSKVIGYYAIYYLNDYLAKSGEGNVAKAHHSLSEAYGFMFSLQFTNDGGDAPYMDNALVSYALSNYFNNFHQQQDVYINGAGNGMIDQIKTAFDGTLILE